MNPCSFFRFLVTYQLIPNRVTPEERRKIAMDLAFDSMLDNQHLIEYRKMAAEMTRFTEVNT